MNVWIVNHYAIPPSMGGLVRHYYFSKCLQKRGHKVRIFTSSKIHNTDINMISGAELFLKKEVDGIEYTFVKSRNYSGNGMDRIFNLADFPFKVWKTMRMFLQQDKPDVIYASSPDLFVAFFALVFGKMHRIPVIMEVRDLWPESIVEYNGMSRMNPVIQVLYQMEKWIYKKSNKIIFTMEGGRDYIQDKKWGNVVDLRKVCYVNNGVDLVEYEKDIEANIFRDPDLDDGEKFKVVYVGSIRTANNVENLVRVAECLKAQGETDISILVYGDGTDRKRLEDECKERGLKNIIFKGKVEKKFVPYILSKSNLNILNYKQATTWKYGGSQNKQFEYLASGRPICANVRMGYSIIEKYGCGVEENIDTVNRYAEIIIMYKNMPKELYQKQCERAKEAAKNYDYNVLSKKIEAILNEVVDK